MAAATTRAYRSLTYFSLGLPGGPLQMKPGDLVPPRFAAVNGHQVAQWLSDGTVVLVTNADSAELERANLRT
jgi:hypothetical protein